jgi:hypothetical protein
MAGVALILDLCMAEKIILFNAIAFFIHNSKIKATTASASMTMIHNQLLLSITHYDSQPLVQYKTTVLSYYLCIVVCYAEPVVVNHGLL